MKPLSLVPSYIYWHYGPALKNILRITGNFTWFLWHFFSIGVLSSTLLSPWQRIQESKVRGSGIEGFLSTLTINFIMRIVGIIIRTVFIVIGILVIGVAICLGALTFILWIFLPLCIVILFVTGVVFITKAIV